MIARIREDDSMVCHGRFRQDASDILRLQCPCQCLDIVELDRLGGQFWIDRGSLVPAPQYHLAILECDQGLVNGPVIAAADDKHLLPSRGLAGQSDGVSVRVGGSHRHLPVWKAESPAK